MPTLSKNIIISVVLALAAAVALVLYVGEVQNQAVTNERTVAVVVALKDVPEGTTVDDAISSGALGIRTMRFADVPNFAVSSLDMIRGQVVTQPLFTGDTVTTTRVGSSNGTSPSYQVKGEERLIRLPLYPNQGMLTDIAPQDPRRRVGQDRQRRRHPLHRAADRPGRTGDRRRPSRHDHVGTGLIAPVHGRYRRRQSGRRAFG